VNKDIIAQSFGKAASSYDKDAPVQKWTAKLLRDYVLGLDIKTNSKCLEIGCGTGFLTEELMTALPNAQWTVTDLSKDMLDVCEARIGSSPTYQVMDGENPNTAGQYDLIVSSLAVQWFHDLEGGLLKLVNLLSPTGRLVFTTLGENTFSQWRENLQRLNKPVGIHDYPTAATVRKFSFEPYIIDVQETLYLQHYDSALHFLRSLKSIGAHEPNSTYVSMTTCEMRKVLRSLEDNEKGCDMSYEILLCDVHQGALK